ncbi:MAG: dihydroorotase [Deltaproteobacteria bacterium]
MSVVVIRGGLVVDPSQGLEASRTVVLEDGLVREIADPGRALPKGAELLEAKGCLVVPGLIDLHTHLREPGEEGKETIATGGRAAAAGGYSALVAMPNTRPPIDRPELVEWVAARARATSRVRVYPAAAVTVGQQGEQLAELASLQAAGAVAFTDDGRPIANAALMRRALEYARPLGLPVMVHEEDPALVAGGVVNEGPTATRLGLRGNPRAAEVVMVLRDLTLCELTGGRLHLAHLSAAASVRAVREAKARGVRVTAEVTPHHFTLTDEALLGYQTNAKMAPPLRGREDVLELRRGLADGTIDAVATDHAPHGVGDKSCELDLAANGVVGLETALALGLALVSEGVLSVSRLVELYSTGPARAFGLPGGSLRPGMPADVTIVDPTLEWTVEPTAFASKGRNTPFAGMKLRGRAVTTVVGGQVVYPFEP